MVVKTSMRVFKSVFLITKFPILRKKINKNNEISYRPAFTCSSRAKICYYEKEFGRKVWFYYSGLISN